jgi:hypothetical protein
MVTQRILNCRCLAVILDDCNVMTPNVSPVKGKPAKMGKFRFEKGNVGFLQKTLVIAAKHTNNEHEKTREREREKNDFSILITN